MPMKFDFRWNPVHYFMPNPNNSINVCHCQDTIRRMKGQADELVTTCVMEPRKYQQILSGHDSNYYFYFLFLLLIIIKIK